MLLIFLFFYSPRFLYHRGAILIYNLCYPLFHFLAVSLSLPHARNTIYMLFPCCCVLQERIKYSIHAWMILFIIYLLFISYSYSYSYYSFVRRTLLFHQKRGGTTERFQTEFKANKQRTTTNNQRNKQTKKQTTTTATTNNKQRRR